MVMGTNERLLNTFNPKLVINLNPRSHLIERNKMALGKSVVVVVLLLALVNCCGANGGESNENFLEYLLSK